MKKTTTLVILMLLVLPTIVQAKSIKPVTVVETYTMSAVHMMPGGRVWATKDDGVLPTWKDFNDFKHQVSFMVFVLGKNTIKTWFTPQSIVAFYSQKYNPGAFSNIEHGKTIYTGLWTTIFKACNSVPQDNVKLGQSVKLLSNGAYLYPNGKELKFENWTAIPKSYVPKNYLVSDRKAVYYAYAFKLKTGGYYLDFETITPHQNEIMPMVRVL